MATQIYQDLVKFFGSQTRTAKALSIKQPSVKAWLIGKANMSEKVAIRAEKVTQGKFQAVDLCPSLKEFSEIQKAKTPSCN